MNMMLALSSICLLAGGLLIAWHALAERRPAVGVRLARLGSVTASQPGADGGAALPGPADAWLARLAASYEESLRRAGRSETVGRLLGHKALLAAAVPLIPLLPYAAAVGRLPSLGLVLLLAAAGFFVPDLVLRAEIKRRHEAIFLDLPDAVAVMSLSLRAGQSLRQALELAARDCPGPLGQELTRALSLARRARNVSDRDALTRIARQSGEPSFERFAELLAAKESPYVEFLRAQAAQMRSEQNRYLERAADRAYLAMHAPLAPLLAVLVLLVAYGFLHFLAQTV